MRKEVMPARVWGESPSMSALGADGDAEGPSLSQAVSGDRAFRCRLWAQMAMREVSDFSSASAPSQAAFDFDALKSLSS